MKLRFGFGLGLLFCVLSSSVVAGYAFQVTLNNTTGSNDKAVLISDTCMKSNVNNLNSSIPSHNKKFVNIEDDASVWDHCALRGSRFVLELESAAGQDLGQITYDSNPEIPIGNGPCLLMTGKLPRAVYYYCFKSSNFSAVSLHKTGEHNLIIDVR